MKSLSDLFRELEAIEHEWVKWYLEESQRGNKLKAQEQEIWKQIKQLRGDDGTPAR